jgi:alkanesulfonate monooxygenase
VSEPPDPVPPIFFGGASPAAEAVAAQQADVYLAWGEPPPALAERLRSVRQRTTRPLRFGVRLHVIARPTAEEAWRVADGLLARIDPAAIERAQAKYGRSESVGQHRMAALHNGGTGALTVYPNLWAGYGLVRGGAGTAIVGSYAEVADRIHEYHDLGIDHFILSGNPHLEEAYWFGEGVLPLLKG